MFGHITEVTSYDLISEKSETVENNNHIKQEPKAAVLNVDNEQKTENVIKDDSPEKDTSSGALVAVAIIGAFIIIALSAVLTVQVIKGRINIRPQTLPFKRKSHVTNQRHVDTYCDIDESNMEEADCKFWREAETYESIDHSKKRCHKVYCSTINIRNRESEGNDLYVDYLDEKEVTRRNCYPRW